MPFDLFVMPNLPVAVSDAGEAWWRATHACLAYAAVVLVTIHLLATLRHHFRLGDTVLTRMILPSRQRDDTEPE